MRIWCFAICLFRYSCLAVPVGDRELSGRAQIIRHTQNFLFEAPDPAGDTDSDDDSMIDFRNLAQLFHLENHQSEREAGPSRMSIRRVDGSPNLIESQSTLPAEQPSARVSTRTSAGEQQQRSSSATIESWRIPDSELDNDDSDSLTDYEFSPSDDGNVPLVESQQNLRLSPLPGPGIYRLTRRHVPVGHEEGPDNRDSEVGSDVPAWSTYDPYVLAQVLQNVDYFAMIDNDADSFRDDVPPAEVAERAIQRQILANVPPEIAENSCPICLLHLSTDSQSVDDNQSDSQSVDDNQSDSQSVDDNQSDSQSVDENQSDNQPDDCSDYNSVDNNTDESIVCLINCQHMFHKRCLLPWIRSEVSSRNCPCCRGTLLDNVDIE